MLIYDRAIEARANQPGDLVWVLCRYVPQKGLPKLMRAWRDPHKNVQVFQDGRVYVLDRFMNALNRNRWKLPRPKQITVTS